MIATIPCGCSVPASRSSWAAATASRRTSAASSAALSATPRGVPSSAGDTAAPRIGTAAASASSTRRTPSASVSPRRSRPRLRWRSRIVVCKELLMMMPFEKAVAAACLAGAVACAPSVQQEVQMGDDYAAEIERTMPLIKESSIRSAFLTSGAPIRQAVNRTGLAWDFQIVNSDPVNAFAVPGGHIYVFRGLIERAAHWDAFAGAVAHEVGHVDLRHSAQQMGTASAANTGLTLAYILLGRQPSAGEQVALGVGGSMVFAKFSRDDEREADSVAVGYMTRARIDPSGMVDM